MTVLSTIFLPCGSRAHFDGDFSYLCEDCFAVVGSVGQPDRCKAEADNWKITKKLGGPAWDYAAGKPQE
jgi:hypothetical protein